MKFIPANQAIDEALAEKIDNAGIEKVKIRSVLTCKSTNGVCAMCYGRDLAHVIWQTSEKRWVSSLRNPSANREHS